MNLSAILLFISAFQVTAMGAAAQTITLSEKRTPLINVLDKIAGQGGLYFLYDDESILQAEPVTIKLKDATVDDALEKLFITLPFKYTKRGKTIVIKSLPSATLPANPRNQDRSVSGQVRDETGNPLAGVTVTVKGTAVASKTDEDGRYQINVPDGATALVFTTIGFETFEAQIGNRIIIDIRMDFAISDLDEVVVVGMNIQQSKRSVTGSVATIQTKELRQSPVANLNNALAGRLPGMISVQRSGQPGADAAELFIRGISTYGSNRAPLVVVDGLPRGAGNFSQIDANEVESISILKDATSAALYGIQGANGVIVVTTKRGKENAVPRINYTSQVATQQPVRLPKSMSSYELALYRNLWDANSGNVSPFDEEALKTIEGGFDPYGYPNVNWFDEILKPSSLQNQHNINVSGSTNRMRYFVSGSFLNQGTLLRHDDKFYENYQLKSRFNRYNFRSNIDLQATELLTLQVDLAGRLEERVGPGAGFGEVFSQISGMLPFAMPIFNPDGTLGAGSYVEMPYWQNPYAMVTQNGYYQNFSNVMYGTISAHHKLDFITDGLSVKANFSFENNNVKGTSRRQNYDTFWYRGKDNEDNPIYQQDRIASRLNTSGSSMIERSNYLDVRLQYDRVFAESHQVNVHLLANKALRVWNDDLPYAYQGVSGRFLYGYLNRYFLEGNLGFNGSENFPKGNRYGLFPSASLSWIVSDEKFFQSDISHLKLRASYGFSGNDKIGNSRWLYISDYTSSPGYRFGSGNATAGAYDENRVGNMYVTWEKSAKANFGVEFGLWNNQLEVIADVFHEKRTDILTTPGSVPDYVGIENLAPRNSGVVANRGVEGEIRYRKSFGELGIFTNINLTYAKNVVLENDEPKPAFPYQDLRGFSVGHTLGYLNTGFFDSPLDIANSAVQNFDNTTIPGDLKYMDVNGDGVIDAFDRVPIKSFYVPELTGGWSFGLYYRGVDFSVLFNGALGATTWSMPRSNDPLRNRHWTPERGSSAVMPVPKHSTNNELASTFWVRSSDYLKLRNAEIGYTIPDRLVRSIRLATGRVFVNGQNLLMWDNAWVKDRDPESPGGSITYPIQRVVNIGVSLSL